MKKILLSTVAVATVLLTQVQAQSVQKDSIVVEKKFKNNYDADVIKNAIKKAALQKSWLLANESGDKLTFEKNFSQKTKNYNHIAYRGQRKIEHEMVTLDVNIAQNGLSIDLGVQDKDSRIAQQAQESVGEIQNSLYASLAASTL